MDKFQKFQFVHSHVNNYITIIHTEKNNFNSKFLLYNRTEIHQFT